MIAIVGLPAARPWQSNGIGGLAGTAAVAAARHGATVQLVGKVGDDPAGDALVLALAAAGVGHVALLRDGSHPTPIEPELGDDALLDAADPTQAEASGAPSPDGRAGPALGGPALDGADVELGLRYLTDFDVLVLIEPVDPAIVAVAGAAADFAGSPLVIVGEPPTDRSEREPATPAIVLAAPADGDPDGAFADALGAFVAAIDAGEAPATALAAARGAVAGATGPA